MTRMPVFAAVTFGLLLTACASTPSVEEANARNAQIQSDCRAKGYRPGTADFETCQALAYQAEHQKKLNTMQATGLGIWGVSTAATLLSDVRVKRDIVPVSRLPNGLQLYRFRYRWSDQLYVGVMAQDVLLFMPNAVVLGPDGYLRVEYSRLDLQLVTWDQWSAQSEPILR